MKKIILYLFLLLGVILNAKTMDYISKSEFNIIKKEIKSTMTDKEITKYINSKSVGEIKKEIYFLKKANEEKNPFGDNIKNLENCIIKNNIDGKHFAFVGTKCLEETIAFNFNCIYNYGKIKTPHLNKTNLNWITKNENNYYVKDCSRQTSLFTGYFVGKNEVKNGKN